MLPYILGKNLSMNLEISSNRVKGLREKITMDTAMETGADSSKQTEGGNSGGEMASHITQRATEILEREEPVDFIIKSFERMHIGDKPTAKYLLASVISQQIKNTKGI